MTAADDFDSLATARQILATRAHHTAGFLLYRYDSELRSRLLPSILSPSVPSTPPAPAATLPP